MSKIYSNNVKKGKLKMFLLFLLITTFIWFLSKFSREFTATVEADIQYENVPQEVVVSSDSYQNVSFDLTTTGFDFLYFKINKPIVTLDILNYYKIGKNKIEIPKNDFNKLITSQLKNNIAVKNVSIESMFINLDILETKKVKIILDKEIQLEKGYKSIGEFKITPEFINISGPSNELDTIEEIHTELLILDKLTNNVDINLKLVIPNNSSLSYSQEEVNISFSVKEFTQKEIKIPVLIKNLPSSINLKLIPEVITISFDVSMDNFNQISENDFSVICDYNNRNIEESFLIPELIKKPDSILNIELKENKVNYLIFK
ncbi:MAG: CdaR family protein [Flavobacteriaceae bacterium]